MTSHTPRGLRRLSLAGFAATAATLVAVASAPTPALAAEIPGVDEIVHSDNLTQLANVPKSAAFSQLNSDLAFQGKYAFSGNYNGFVVYDISVPTAPAVVSEVLCVGAQNDISVLGNLLFLSTDSSRSDDSCNSTALPASDKNAWEGIKIFDITDKAAPKYIKSVETNCGSHTHTLVPSKKDVYVYVSSYSPSSTYPDCLPPHDAVSIIKVPLSKPTDAAVIAAPNLFPDGGNPGGNGSSSTTGCHDITAYPAKKIAAGACMGDGILLDISNPEAPVVTERVRDLTNFAFWHSASFNNAGTKVVFTDELGGGGLATCNPEIGPNRGADAVYDLAGGKLEFKSYFKIPRENAFNENCVAHNGSIIPAFGRDILVQAWYQGGVSVWDFTDSANPVELGYWERGPLSATGTATGGSWSAYYYNGLIYSNDIAKGFDVLKLDDPRTNSAAAVRFSELNVQTQPQYPACDTVLRDASRGISAKRGVTCVDGGTIRGKVEVSRGATLLAYGATVAGDVRVTGGGTFSLLDSSIAGDVWADELAQVYVAGNRITGDLDVHDTAGAVVISGNTIGGSLECEYNKVAPVNDGVRNTVDHREPGACAEL
ncbi:hypothetical protein JCM9534A_51050 [Catenuloplanes indicus JCM 9534]|uniref:LVIVD repeat-containing protein n=1 Tax=Catenuloplanes indicus TaxID=137267 RepID=A0AAE3W2B8_9ACTN|nr:hypothetical protein [Catenuloplanes indicus]